MTDVPRHDRMDLAEELARMWESLLGVEKVNPDDDFFEVGGNSITAVRLVPLISSRFGVEPDIGVIFDHPTPADLADALHQLMAG